jgi:uncharacterized protein
MLRAVLIAVTAVVVASPASAASFNCKRAKLPAEIAICADTSLGAQDDELAHEYGPLLELAATDDVKAIKKEEDAWLASRNACGSDKQCIAGRYRERLQRLGEWEKKIAAAAAAAQSGAEAPAVDPNGASIAPVAPTVAPAADDNGSSN